MGARRDRGDRPRRAHEVSRGIYLLPNLFTSGSVLCGFWSLILSAEGRFVWAAGLVLGCQVFDMLDGRIARLTNTTSRFGEEYDSLADVIGFGVAPSFLVYQWALSDYGRWGWLFAFLFVALGAVRLARFNATLADADPTRFVGLPIPVAASVVATTVLVVEHFGIDLEGYRSPLLLVQLFTLSSLMVSTVPYRSFKDLNLRDRKPVWVLLPVLGALMLLVAEPQITLFLVCLAYTLSGPIEALAGRSGDRAPSVPLSSPPDASERQRLELIEGRGTADPRARSAEGNES